MLGIRRLRAALWPIIQTSTASGLAWYLAHDVLHHQQPFFAPMAATLCLSSSNVLRSQRAAQMILGVGLGIGVGAVVQTVLGVGAVGIAVAVFLALSVAVLSAHGYVGQGLTFVNQTAVSALLVLVLVHGDAVLQRAVDALIGGGLALVFSVLLFPAEPLQVLRTARVAVLTELRDVLNQAMEAQPVPGWVNAAVDRVHEQLGLLIQARDTVRQVVLAPRRWSTRDRVAGADRQAESVALLADSVLKLARAVDEGLDNAHLEIGDLAAAIALVEADPEAAIEHVVDARRGASAAFAGDPAARNIVISCADDLRQVIDLRSR